MATTANTQKSVACAYGLYVALATLLVTEIVITSQLVWSDFLHVNTHRPQSNALFIMFAEIPPVAIFATLGGMSLPMLVAALMASVTRNFYLHVPITALPVIALCCVMSLEAQIRFTGWLFFAGASADLDAPPGPPSFGWLPAPTLCRWCWRGGGAIATTAP